MAKKILFFIFLLAVIMPLVSHSAYGDNGFFGKITELFTSSFEDDKFIEEDLKQNDNKAIENFRCDVYFEGTKNDGIVSYTINECRPFINKHSSKSITCQGHSNYIEISGTALCDFCLDKFLKEINEDLPESCIQVSITEIEGPEHNSQEQNKYENHESNENFDFEYKEVARVTYIKGDGYILREGRIIPLYLGNKILCNDVIQIEEGSEAAIILEGKEIEIPGGTGRTFPACEQKKEKGFLLLPMPETNYVNILLILI